MPKGMPGSTPTCSIFACGQPAKARGWCEMHYMRWLRHGDPLREVERPQTCAVDGCTKPPPYCRGLCHMHYTRWRRRGEAGLAPDAAYPITDPRYRMIRGKPCWVLDEQSGCWVWNAARSDTGYGSVHDGRRVVNAHRWMYELHRGPIPEGMELDHLCVNPPCVNPDHLEPVTPQVNTLRSRGQGALNAAKTHCPQGHEYTPDNIYWQKKPNGRRTRRCRTCQLLSTARHRTSTSAP